MKLLSIVLILAATSLPAVADLTQEEIIANRHAKMICSAVFVSGRSAEDLLTNEHGVADPSTVDYTVDTRARIVKVEAETGYVATAVYREECGCTLVYELTPKELRRQRLGRSGPPRVSDTVRATDPLWPKGERIEIRDTPGLNRVKLNGALAYAFAEPSDEKIRGTRGVVVVQDGRIVAERYAAGYDQNMPLIAWSMTKSITNALTGILVKEGKLDIHAPAPVPEWSDAGDPRGAITTDQLLRMSSGLKFQEVYQLGLIDVVVMLYGKPDAAGFAASQPLEHDPDEVWAYSSGTTNIISRMIRHQLDDDLRDYARFARRELFGRIGMDRTTLEMDESGTYIGSSFMFSTPRDMARFGQFCLQDGVWNGRRILPEGWMAYSTTPTPKAPQGMYGAQFWLNAGEPDNPENRVMPDVPADAYWLSGYQGQRVLVVPSRDVVIVRMGFTPETEGIWDWNFFLSEILDALPHDTE